LKSIASFAPCVGLASCRSHQLREWEYLKRDLDALEEITVNNAGRTFVIRSRPRGNAAKALQPASVALGPTVRFCP
jgi:hypothetical protein